jgi:hypothetical protein
MADFERLEKELAAAGRNGPAMPSPDVLDLAIERGIRRAKRARRAVRFRAAGSTVAAFLLAFAIAVNVSPAFAMAVSKIPVLNWFVWVVEQDSGIRLALEKEYYQPVGLTVEQDGYRLTVEGLVADEGRLVLFYAEEGGTMGDWRFLDADGQQLVAGITASSPPDREARFQSVFDINMADGHPVPETVVLEAASPSGTPFRLEIPVDHSLFAGLTEVFEIGETVEVEGQRFTVEKAVLSPARIAVHIVPDPGNTKRIFSFHDLRLLADGGEEIGKYGGSGPDAEGKIVYYFPSPYFKMPKSITLVGERLGALDKDNMEVAISLKEKRVLKAPTDQVTLDSITRMTDYWLIKLNVKVLADWDTTLYHVINESAFTDGTGRSFGFAAVEGGVVSASFESFGAGDRVHTQYIRIPAEHEYTDPLTFTISHYPAYLSEPFEVRIK